MAGTKLEPWKAHARRLRGAGRSVRDVMKFLEAFYGRKFGRGTVHRMCGTRAALSSDSLEKQIEANNNHAEAHEVTGSARDHRNDDAERWLSRNDPRYAETRRQWQQPRTDAVARMSLTMGNECSAEDKEVTAE